jgi:hypothetical protein
LRVVAYYAWKKLTGAELLPATVALVYQSVLVSVVGDVEVTERPPRVMFISWAATSLSIAPRDISCWSIVGGTLWTDPPSSLCLRHFKVFSASCETRTWLLGSLQLSHVGADATVA